MPPTLVLIRHAQAIHNINRANHALRDPSLTDLGHRQSAELREHLRAHFPADRKVQLIVTSPMRRALQTALVALDWLVNSGVPVLYPKPCDTGTSAAQLATEFPAIDFSALDPVYPDKTSAASAAYRYKKGAVLARGQSALADLYERAEDVVIVVSHSGFLRTAVAGRWFANADYRVFDFVSREGKDEEEPYRLVEWDLTRGKGGMGRSEEGVVEFGEGLPGL
ncbi:histidine phosphatase superfamily [Corynascus novoguineensis]|uniref:Histidine phosphatase superfamily n=1 Tax=Corynascus novoguineensis TaxID=1126955 RepID=A0AAN7CTE2_9PEZI|nr:histidine phosphatase superfamily [Corynascus novoguineensis]